jgi:hypothetical protein
VIEDRKALGVRSNDFGILDYFSKIPIKKLILPEKGRMQILMASTYPAEVADADRFVRANPHLTGDSHDQALRSQPWDPSVKSLCRYPGILSTMAEHIDWTAAQKACGGCIPV